MGNSELTLMFGLAYLLVGCAVGGLLHRFGHSGATTASALVVWPMLLSLIGEAPAPYVAGGPFTERIEATFASLCEALGDPAAGEAAWDDEVEPLRSALVAADHRIAFVDRLLGDGGDCTPAAAHTQLSEARTRAAAEIEDVLTGVVELRLQVGLLALAGNTVSVREQLRAFHARARALAEVSDLAAG